MMFPTSFHSCNTKVVKGGTYKSLEALSKKALAKFDTVASISHSHAYSFLTWSRSQTTCKCNVPRNYHQSQLLLLKTHGIGL